MNWRYVEPCCGSASIALALLGARRAILPYQGSKWRLRAPITKCFNKLGFGWSPRRIDITDIGPWGVVARSVLDPVVRDGVVGALRFMSRLDPRDVYTALHQQPVPSDSISYSAQFLFLQRLAYSGKAVGETNGCWSSPGFNKSSAYGLAGTERFGEVKPMIPSLISVLESYGDLLLPQYIAGARADALEPDGPAREATLVYIDPPYEGSTGYPGGEFSPRDVVDLAEKWKRSGATVVVSESHAVDELVFTGWEAIRIDEGRKDTSRFRGKQQEWLTYWARYPSFNGPS